MTVKAHPLFEARDPERARAALRELDDGRLIASLSGELTAALRGSDAAARAYVRDYRRLTSCLLSEAQRVRPDLVVATALGLAPVDAAGRPATALTVALESAAADAPFGPWAGRYEPGDAVALALLSRLRPLVGARELPAGANGAPPVEVDDMSACRFIRRVRQYLNEPDQEPPLERIMSAFALSKTELGGLFGVSRQAIDHWRRRGVPGDRQDKLQTLLALTDLLERKLKPGRLPGVVRRPAGAYGGLTMLEMIARDRQRELLDSVRASFDWQTAA